jgi:hypothetical protein
VSDNSEIYLKKFYNRLAETVSREELQGGKQESLFFSFVLKRNSIKNQSILRQSTIGKEKIPQIILDSLLEEESILQTDHLGEFIISTKGIWEYETKNDIITIDALLKYLNSKLFRFKLANEEFRPREKIVVFSLLAIRAFSEEIAVNLNKGDTTYEAWNQIIISSIKKLVELGVLPQNYTLNTFFIENKTRKKAKKVNRNFEDPMIYVFRHIYKLPEKTMHILKNPGNRRYYLDLGNNDSINENGFKYLIKKIFEGVSLSFQDLENIIKFFDEISFQYSPIIFESGKNQFVNPSYTEKIKDILLYGDL